MNKLYTVNPEVRIYNPEFYNRFSEIYDNKGCNQNYRLRIIMPG